MNKAKLVIKKGNLKVVLFFEEPVMVVKTVIQAKGCAVSRFPLGKLKEEYYMSVELQEPSRQFFDPYGIYLPLEKSANKTATDFVNGKHFSSKLWRLVCGTFNKYPLVFKQRMFDDIKENLNFFLGLGGGYESLEILEDTLQMIKIHNQSIGKNQNLRALIDYIEREVEELEEED
jgi:hypothetical protein